MDGQNHLGVVLLPFALLDFALVYGCFKLAGNAIKQTGRDSSPN
jgi:hypothetical protein